LGLRELFCLDPELLVLAAMLLAPVRPLAQGPAQKTPAAVENIESYESSSVQAIAFVGIPNPNSGALLQMIPQKPGAPLDRGLIRESIKTLYATGRFADIRAEV